MSHVAVVIPFRNTARWLADALRSAKEPCVRLIVAVNDASEDGSLEVATRMLAECAPALEVFSLPAHENQYAAMNLGVARALAFGRHPLWNTPGIDYIAFLDSDDIALPGRFAHQQAVLDADPGLAVVGGPTIEIDAHDNELHDGQLALQLLDDPLPTLLRRFGIGLWTCTAMYRREVFEALGGFMWTPTMGDTDFAVRTAFWCALRGYSMRNEPEPVNRRRIHPQQVQQTTGSSKAPYKVAVERFLQQRHAFFALLHRQGLLQAEHLHLPNPWIARAWPAPETS